MRHLKLSGILLILMVASFQGPAPEVQAQRPPQSEVVWPLPPEQPRIRFVGTIGTERDIGKKPGFFSRVKNTLIGTSDAVVSIDKPHDVDVDDQGRVFVTNGRRPGFWVFDKDAKEARFVQPAGQGRLSGAMGLGLDGDGNIYVADPLGKRVVAVDRNGRFIQAFGGEGVLLNPVDVTVSPSGDRIYVVDAYLHQVVVFDGTGEVVKNIGRAERDLAAIADSLGGFLNVREVGDIWANRGVQDGEFRFPAYAFLSATGTLYVTDQLNSRVQAFDSEGQFLLQVGRLGDSRGDFARPKGVASDRHGNIYVVDAAFNNIQIFNSDGALLMAFGGMGDGDGRLWLPGGVAIDQNDQIFVADRVNNRIQVYQLLAESGASADDPSPVGSQR